MASTRKLPSGNYQGKAYRPDGKPVYETFPLKAQAQHWAEEEEAKYRTGDVRDPRAGGITVAAWFERWSKARRVVEGTKAKTLSLWRTHCEAQWGRWPMNTIQSIEAQEWVGVLEAKRGRRGEPLGAATVSAIVFVMSSLFNAAMRHKPPIIGANPFADLELPEVPPATIMFYDHDEADALLAALERWPMRQALVELGLWAGLREGEMFGLMGDRVRWIGDGLVQVTRVMTRHGLREYPKTRKSIRAVPVRPSTMDKLRPLMAGRPLDGPVFTRAEGGLIDDDWFRKRVWLPAVKAAGVRPLPPRAMRHTAASWLVQAGTPLTEVQRLLGHESYSTTLRYAHLAPGNFDAVLNVWAAIEAQRTRRAAG